MQATATPRRGVAPRLRHGRPDDAPIQRLTPPGPTPPRWSARRLAWLTGGAVLMMWGAGWSAYHRHLEWAAPTPDPAASAVQVRGG